MTSSDLELIKVGLDVVKSLGFGAGAIALMILAWQAPKILREFLAFVRLVIKDLRTPPKQESSRTPQISKPQ